MASIGELVKQRRIEKQWSLRRLATELGVTAAYVADIEAERRLPGPELKERLAAALEIPSGDLAAADSRLPGDVKEWIEERPQLTALLKSLHSAPDADGVIQRLSRFVRPRTPPEPPRTFIVTWESELRAIAAEAAAWSIETGGDLFGRWNDVPIVLLATKAGPAARRDNTHFRLDVDYLRDLSGTFATDWGLRYFGDWHSHHRLGLSGPSTGDRRRIVSVAGRNQFVTMAEVIVTLEESQGEPTVRIHPWLYNLSASEPTPLTLGIKVLPGMSPIREALIVRGALPEQSLVDWEKIGLSRIRIGGASSPPTLEPIRDVDSATREASLAHLTEALQAASGGAVERHTTGFGCILVVPLRDQLHLAYAVSATWPLTILEIHKIDRRSGTSTALRMPEGFSALNVQRAIAFFAEVAASEGGLDVDS